MKLTVTTMVIAAAPLEVREVTMEWEDQVVFEGRWKGAEAEFSLSWGINPRSRHPLILMLDVWLSPADEDYEGKYATKTIAKESVISREMRDFLNAKNFRTAEKLRDYLKSVEVS